MAVVPMQRISIAALKKERKALLEALQRKGVIEIIENSENDEKEVFKTTDCSVAIERLNRHANDAQKALEILDKYAPEKKSMLAFLDGKEVADKSKYDDFVNYKTDARLSADKIIDYDKSIRENKAEIIKIQTQIEMIEPWSGLDVPLDFNGTKSTAAFIGTLPGSWTEEAIYEKFALFTPFEFEILSIVHEQSFIFIMCLKQHEEAFFEALRAAGFSRAANSGKEIPAVQKENLLKAIENLEKDIEKSTAAIESLAEKREIIKFYWDYEVIREEKYSVIDNLMQSKHTFVINGYIPKKEAQALKDEFENKFNCVIEIEDLAEDEEAPVMLSNNAFAQPLESITEGFSMPGKGEMDPTGAMSLFYYVLFGMMFSDFGYGLILFLGCGILLLKFKNMEASMRSMLKMFFFCGISTMFWGVMFSSYFGDVVDIVSKNFFGKEVSIPPLWFSPNDEPMRMLVFSMICGLVHLMTGLLLKFYQCCKQGKVLDGIYDGLFWIVLVLSLVVYLMSVEAFTKIIGTSTLSADVGQVAAIIAGVAAVGIILTGGRESKNVGKRLAKGAYALYGVSSYLGDILSYSRLLALGLATGVIASVVNQMGAMSGTGVAKAIIFVIVFIVGHLLNFAINILGAYVHTNRLQYVEFFGKFYDGGGRKFTPFSTKTKFYNIKENGNNG